VNDKPWGIELKTFCMLMHLSMLAGYVIPGAGLILPIVMWATNKDDFHEVDRHGKNILNWLISFVIYAIISWMLIFVIVGIIMLPILMLCNLVFVIIGAVKANDEIVWKYPLSITFFTVPEAKQDTE